MTRTEKAVGTMIADGFEIDQIKAALCDGSALSSLGLDDSDQVDIENAIADLW
jgi:hypothetical protein